MVLQSKVDIIVEHEKEEPIKPRLSDSFNQLDERIEENQLVPRFILEFGNVEGLVAVPTPCKTTTNKVNQ